MVVPGQSADLVLDHWRRARRIPRPGTGRLVGPHAHVNGALGDRVIDENG
jgi:hypothetical protein